MIKTLLKIATKFPDRVAKAIYTEAQIIMTESKRRCPVAKDGGTLRASGRVNPPEREGRKIWCTLSYGGAATPYALAVHEHLSEHSPPSWIKAEQSGDGVHWTSAGTGPKFLENPIKEAQPTLAQKIAQRISFDQPDVLG
jgi:hypothetical protein